MQDDIPHTPATHAAVPLLEGQTRPQAPQWERLVAVLTSQPSAELALQLAQPAEQVPSEQEPAVQTPVAWA